MIKSKEVNKKWIANQLICPDCNAELIIPNDIADGEIVTCPCCGLELEIKIDSKSGVLSLQELLIEGEDWGE